MDAVAAAVTELVLSQECLPQLLNVVHPKPVGWHDVMVNISDSVAKFSVGPLQLVSMNSWLQSLEDAAHAGTHEDLERLVGKLPPNAFCIA